jgi:hypothetical protein
MRRARSIFDRSLSLVCSFLLLEDDYDVDWEVDQDEPGRDPARGRDAIVESRTAELHPHRTTLRGRSARVRAGQPAPAAQVCVCPVGGNSTVSIPSLPQAPISNPPQVSIPNLSQVPISTPLQDTLSQVSTHTLPQLTGSTRRPIVGKTTTGRPQATRMSRKAHM